MASKCTLSLIVFVTIAILETLLFAFLQAGWSSYIYILMDNGYYSNLCQATNKYNVPLVSNSTNKGWVVINEDNNVKTNHVIKYSDIQYNFTLNDGMYGNLSNEKRQESTGACHEQQEHLHLLYTISTVLIELFIVAWGPLVFRFGVPGPKIISMILFTSGCLMLGLSNKDIPLLIVPGLTLVSFGGFGVVIMNMEVTSVLPYGKGLFIAILNGACDSSVITFRVIKSIHEAGVPDLYPFIGLIITHIVVSGTSLVFHKKYPKQLTLETYEVEPPKDKNLKNEIELQTTHLTTEDESKPNEKHRPSLKDSLCSVLTISSMFWVSILMLNFLMYLGTINARLQETFPDKVSHFTNVLAYAMIGGIISSLIPGTVFEWQFKMFKDREKDEEKKILPNVLPLTIASILATSLNVLSFFKSAAVFYTEFAVLTVFRSFLYSTFMSFTVSVYPLKHANVLFPLGLTIGGLISMVQIAIFNWYNQSETAELHVKIFMTLLVALTLIHPIITFIKSKGVSKNSTKETRKRSSKSIAI